MEKSVRHKRIIDRLKEKNIATVKELASLFLVCEMTIRRDIFELTSAGEVEAFYGGITLKNNKSNNSYYIEEELREKTEQKKRIAKKAAALIKPNEVILIDTGSTTGGIIEYIPDNQRHIVYCYALNIINGVCAKPNLRVVASGGLYHYNTGMFESKEGASLIQKTFINKAFLAARGLTEEVGITTAEPYEIHMKRAILSVSEEKILLIDSSKFGKAWYAKYADLDEIDIVITDDEIEDKYKKLLEDCGITLYVV